MHALDLKGFGENKGMPYPYGLYDYAEEVKEYCYSRGVARPNVIAHSFGGRIALKMAYENPNAFNKIVLTGSAGLKPKLTLKKLIKKSAFKLLKPFVPKSKLKRFYSADYLALSPIMRESFKKIICEHLDYTLDSLQNKTLIVFGENDSETPLYMARKLNKKIKNSRLIIIKNAGHFCFIDKPFTFNTEVREFLLSD